MWACRVKLTFLNSEQDISNEHKVFYLDIYPLQTVYIHIDPDGYPHFPLLKEHLCLVLGLV